MKQQTTPYPQKAATHFKQGYNCAQSILLTMQEYYGNKHNKLIPKIATAFGAGIGRQGSLCGALTSGVMAIGLKHGTNEPSLEKRLQAYTLARQLYEKFTQEFSTPFCLELIGYDLTKPEELEKAQKAKVFDKKCTHFIKKTIEILINLETEHSRASSGI